MKRGFQTRITAQVKIHRETGVGARQLETHFKAIDYAKRGDGQYDDATFWHKFCRISTLQKFGVFPLGREKNLIYTPWELKLKPLNSGNLPLCKEKKNVQYSQQRYMEGSNMKFTFHICCHKGIGGQIRDNWRKGDGTTSVETIRIADFINNVVATRRFALPIF